MIELTANHDFNTLCSILAVGDWRWSVTGLIFDILGAFFLVKSLWKSNNVMLDGTSPSNKSKKLRPLSNDLFDPPLGAEPEITENEKRDNRLSRAEANVLGSQGIHKEADAQDLLDSVRAAVREVREMNREAGLVAKESNKDSRPAIFLLIMGFLMQIIGNIPEVSCTNIMLQICPFGSVFSY